MHQRDAVKSAVHDWARAGNKAVLRRLGFVNRADNPEILTWMLVMLLSIFYAGGGLANIPYTDIIGKVIPAARMGAFFGGKGALAGPLSMGAALLAGQILENVDYPNNYALLFGLAAFGLALASLGFWMIKEPPAADKADQIESWKPCWSQIVDASRLIRILIAIQLLTGFSFLCSACSPEPSIQWTPSSTQIIGPTQVARVTTLTPTSAMKHPFFTPQPTVVPSQLVEMKEETMTPTNPANKRLVITVVYDNNAYDPRLKTAWGFSALVEYQDQTLLFDTGGDGPTLLNNMHILGIDPTRIQSVVLSHAHGDHTGGLGALLEVAARPIVYVPPSFSASYKNQLSTLTEVVEVSPGLSISTEIYSSGEMGQGIPEQALVVKTEPGLVVITGCAHPGIVEIVARAAELFQQPIHLVLGGFHLGSKSSSEIEMILLSFRTLGVEQVAPCHCTGDHAIRMFARMYEDKYIKTGVGKIIQIEN